MDTSAIYHRPESEYAYLYQTGHFHIRLRTKRGDIAKVALLSGDPYALGEEQWQKKDKPMHLQATTATHDYWMIDTHEETKRLAYAFHLTGQDGMEALYTDRGVFPFEEEFLENGNAFFRMPYLHEIDRFRSPEWVKETVWYQIFPERFANGSSENDPEGTLPWGSKEHPGRGDYFGGDLQGVIDHLDYLVELGINGIYFCPIFKASSNHKYDTVDYYEIDPDFGDKETFRKLVEEAHKRGIRVMLDAVFNHLGMKSKQWQDVLENQEASRYADWFHIHQFPVQSMEHLTVDELEDVGRLTYDTFAFTGHMPKLNTGNPEVQEYLLDIVTYWIREFDIDSWRLDVANEVDHHFWKKFHQAAVSIKEDFYILGEIWHSSQSWLQGDEFHAVMNYAYNEVLKDFFIGGELSPSKMVSGLNEQLMLYRRQTNEVMFNLLDSHDTPRILTTCDGDKSLTKAVLAFMFAQQGTPCIFYGTEIGLEGEQDPDCRRCMVWDKENQDTDMLQFTKDLIAFRKQYQPILSFGDLNWHDVRDEQRLVGFKRQLNEDVLYGYFNQGKEAVAIPSSVQPEQHIEHSAAFKKGTLTVEPGGFVLYKTRI